MSQDHQGRRVYQVSQGGQDPLDSQELLVFLDPKVNQVLLESDHLEHLDPRYRSQPPKFCGSEKLHSISVGSHFVCLLCLIG